jgi:class 3 adenylate cyclase/predicted ATPase
MICSNCGADNPTGLKFCEQCAAPFKKRCARCGFENSAAARFCGECAAPLSAAAPGLAPQPGTTPSVQLLPKEADTPALEGERKTVTALFADIKGSTELMRDLDPEEARAIVDPALKLMIDAAHRYDGYVVQSTGDGIFALFGAPVAHEDHPQRALHAALAMQQQLRNYAQRRGTQADHRLKPVPLEVRIGINTGEVVLRMVHTGGHTEYTPVGHAANLAARMQTVAPAGGIVISEDTRHLVEGYFELRDLGPTEVKGISEPINVYEVIGAGPARGHFELSARRGLTRFVGREREVAEMKRALELARSGHGQIVAAVAEAGTGKSRLVYEFKAMLPGDCKVLEAYSVSHGKASAYLPVLELLYGYFGIEEADDKAARRGKIETRLSALDPALNDTLPLLYTLMGLHEGPDPLAQMDPQIKRRRILDAIKRIILRESLNQPTVLIFEDLHWIDGETQALLDLLADGIANSRILLLVNYRPEYRHEWTNKSYYTQLRLDALGRESAAEMLSTLLGDGVELEPLKRTVIERTEGNPFFIEEMVQALFDEGALVRNGGVKVARSLAQLRLPPTVQGILAARIDRLGAEEKDLLQTLAVLGRESPLALIRQVVSRPDGGLEQMLSTLQTGEFIYEQPAASALEYTFKHALTQEVAYNSLLFERRKVLHERAGVAMESLYAERVDDHLSELAHHYSRTDNVSKAVDYLERAGQQAMQRSAHADAIKSFSTAIDLIQKLPDPIDRIRRELPLQLVLGPALMVKSNWASPEVERAYTRARELCGLVGDETELPYASFGLWHMYLCRAEFATAQSLAEQLLQRAHSARDPMLLVLGELAVGETLSFMGRLVSAREHLETAISLHNPTHHQSLAMRYPTDPGVWARTIAALVLWRLGYPDQALRRTEEAITLAKELSHRDSQVYANLMLTFQHQFRRDPRALQQTADGVIAFCEERGLTDWLAWALSLRGWALAVQGRYEVGIAQLRTGLALSYDTGMKAISPMFNTLLAEALMQAGRLEEAVSALAEGAGPEKYQLKGELLLKQNNSNASEAQSCFQRAVEMARNQSAKSLELRATMSLARLLAKQGRRDEARMMLADIYGWFTEGFDTADLKDARALLDELGAK